MEIKLIKQFFNIDRIIAIIAIVISVLLTPSDDRYIIIFLVLLLVVVYYSYFQIKKYHKKPQKKYSRFEELLKRDFIYSFIDYEPFFKRDENENIGIGATLLKKIFDKNIYQGKLICLKKKNTEEPFTHNWNSIFEHIACKKSFDIIATPMYETRSRLYNFNIIYCIPLFYSTIGIYVKKDLVSINGNNENKIGINLSFENAKEEIINKGWSVEIIKGEISHLLAKKHFKKSVRENMPNKKADRNIQNNAFYEKLKNVESDIEGTGNFILMEVFKAEDLIAKHNLNLINILKKNNLIFPVSFVVRKEDTVLRNFINLRLAELKEKGELINIIKNESAKYIDYTKDSKFEDKFIQTYDFSLLKEEENE